MYPYRHVKTEGGRESLTVFMPDGAPIVATADHPHFADLLEGAQTDLPADELRGLADLSVAAATKFDGLSERVAVANGHVYFDGDKVDSTIGQQIVRCLDDPTIGDWKPLVLFMENVANNPDAHSREQLFDWLRDREFTIASNGCFLAYKGVATRDAEDDDYPYQSSNTGEAITDGVRYQGNIPCGPGSTVEMPRGEVQHNPSEGCSTGLHVGTHRYATGFGSRTLTVLVNPRDVVSVPTDCNAEKMRVCRYVVQDDDAVHPSESPAIAEAQRWEENGVEFVKSGEVRPPRAGEFYLYGEGTDDEVVGRAILDYTGFGGEYDAPILEAVN